MKKWKMLLMIALIMVVMIGCTRVPPGYVGIKVDLLGGDRGEMQIFETGRYGKGLNTEWHKFPTFKQNYVWTQDANEGSKNDESFTFPIEGMVVGLDVGIEYSLIKEQIPEIFTSYRKGVDDLTDITIRNEVRDAFYEFSGDYTMDSLISGGMTTLMASVFESTAEYFQPKGIIIHSLSLVNAPKYPESIVKAIEMKNGATQRAAQAENELREAVAEAEKKKAQAEGEASRMVTIAQAEAEVNKLRTKSLTKEILQLEWITKWDGHLPEVSAGESSGMLFTIN